MTRLTAELLKALNNLGGGWPEAEENSFSRVIPCVSDDVRQLYVDTVNGDDENGGESADDALATIQEAVLRFKSPFRTPVWEEGEDRVITVIYTAGMPLIEESIVVPPHMGEGILRIQAQRNVIHQGLLVDGAFANTAGTAQTRVDFNFTGATLVASALAKGAFLTPQSFPNTSNTLSEIYEFLPVIDNGVSSFEVVAVAAGTLSAFEWSDGVAFDVVAPQISWAPSVNSEPFFPIDTQLVLNMGGPIMIEDFDLQPAEISGFGRSSGHMMISNLSSGADINDAGTAQLVRCTLTHILSGGIATGGLVAVNVIADTGGTLFQEGQGSIVNSIFTPVTIRGEIVNFDLNVYGLLYDAGAVARTLDFVGCDAGEYIYADIQGTQLKVLNSKLKIDGLRIENAGNQPALLIDERSFVDFTDGADIEGSTGNTNFGCLVDRMSFLGVSANAGSIALTGSSGNLQVGSGAVASTWGGGAVQSAAGRNSTYSG